MKQKTIPMKQNPTPMKQNPTPIKQNLHRSHAMTFRVTEEERDMIRRRQEQSGIINMRHYLLKMAVDGRVINIELDSVKEMNHLLSNISNNINQIARRVNITGDVYGTDIDDIIAKQGEIWAQQKSILNKLNQLLDAVRYGAK
jgi:hypothetical protein